MRDNEFAAGYGSICFYYPIVIINGKLYEAYLDKGDIVVKEAKAVMISFFYESSKYKDERFIVPIVTEGFLNKNED